MSEPADEPRVDPHRVPDATAADGAEGVLDALAEEFAGRVRRGERPSVEEYARRHPALAERARSVLAAVAAIEGAGTSAHASDPVGDAVGTTVGRYKLLERIGEGGFGVVYMAEQHQPVRRRVALKLVKPGMDSRQVLARFEAERQALAIMDHPNIAKVFDGGMTDAGRPYFVMELVRGEPVTEFCDRNQLPPRQRLELFAQVCHAVQHAHQKGIIHRDLKPNNVLVSMHDATPVVKVIDFGIAKALGQELTDKTLFTGFAQLLGTPLYMSPEQAGESGLDVDTRSDVYSLGVLLYELLTGTTPFDKERFRKAAHDEIRRIIREEEPPRPSTRLNASKDRLPSISAQRRTEPAKLAKLVRGELDWIVMRALEKDRSRRYETANAFASDVQRYLADEQVLACPPSTVYRFRKFARRNKGRLAMAALALSFLVLSGGGVGWAARDRAARHAKVAGQVESILSEVDQLQREQKWPEGLAAARRAEAVLTGAEADAATVRRVRDRLRGLDFIDRLERIRMSRATGAGPSFDAAATDRRYAQAFREFGVDLDALAADASIGRLKASPALAVPLAAALDDWVGTRREVSNDAAGWRRLVEVARAVDPEPLRDRLRSAWGAPASEVQDELRRLADSISVPAQHPATLESLARTLFRTGQSDAALRLLRDAQFIHPGDFWLNFELGRVLLNRGDNEGAMRHFTAAIAVRPKSAPAHNNVSYLLRNQKKWDESMAFCRKAIELDPTLADAHVSLSALLCDHLKDYDNAIESARTAIALDPEQGIAYHNLGHALRQQNRLDEAIDALHKATQVDPKHVESQYKLANTLAQRGKLPEAVAAFHRVIELDPKHVGAHNNLGAVLSEHLKDYRGAIECFQRVIELAPELANTYNNLGLAHAKLGQWKQAAAAYARGAEVDPSNYRDWSNAAATFLADGNMDEYRRCCREMVERFGGTADPVIAERAAMACSLAPGSVPDFRRVERLAELAVTGTQAHERNGYFALAKGVTLYRAGRHAEAVPWLEWLGPRAEGKSLNAIAFATLAMVQHRLDSAEQAKANLTRAKAILTQKMPDVTRGQTFEGNWHGWCVAPIFCREAEEMLAGRTDPAKR